MTQAKRKALFFTFLCLFLSLGSLLDAQAQEWQQDARIIVPVEDVPHWEGPRGALYSLLDSLVATAKKSEEKYTVKRTPSQEEEMSISALEEDLIVEEGIGLRSASHAIIEYHFSFNMKNEFRESIKNVYYIFKTDEYPLRYEEKSDIPIMYVNIQKEWIQGLFVTEFYPHCSGQNIPHIYRRTLRFSRLYNDSDSKLIDIGGKNSHKIPENKKDDLVNRVQRLTHNFLVE